MLNQLKAVEKLTRERVITTSCSVFEKVLSRTLRPSGRGGCGGEFPVVVAVRMRDEFSSRSHLIYRNNSGHIFGDGNRNTDID